MTTDDIQKQIERTRGEMAGTLHAIERKLSPRQLMDQAVDTMRELVGGTSQVGTLIRDNPLPLAVIGLGVGWLALSGTLGRRGDEAGDADPASEPEAVTPAWSETASGYASAAEAAPSGESLRDQARESLQRATEAGRRQVAEWSSSVRGAAGDAADRTAEVFQDHPLTMGAAALVLGAAIGAMLPRTSAEQRMIGGSGQGILRQAREAGNDLMDRAGRVAKRAIHAAKEKGSEAIGQAGAAVKAEAETLH